MPMSFGFGVGDFIALIEYATKIRKAVVDAPSQFQAISDECDARNRASISANYYGQIVSEVS